MGRKQTERAVERAEKREVVTALHEVFAKTGVVVVAHYTGLTVAAMTTLRSEMRGAGGQRQGRQEPPRQARSRRHRRQGYRGPLEGADLHRLFSGSGRGSEGRRRLRQGEREVRHPWRSDGQTASMPTALRRSPTCRRSTNCGPSWSA